MPGTATGCEPARSWRLSDPFSPSVPCFSTAGEPLFPCNHILIETGGEAPYAGIGMLG